MFSGFTIQDRTTSVGNEVVFNKAMVLLFIFSGTSFEQDGLNAHNYYRAYHDSPPMTLNNEMSSAAAAYAKKIASTGSMQHSSRDEREGQGENLYMSCTSKSAEESAATAVKKW